MVEYPVTLDALLTVAGIAVLGGLATQWLKLYVKNELQVNALCLALCLAFAEVAQAIQAAWRPSAEQILLALLVGFFGASLATFGYETIKNIAKAQRPPTA